MAAKETRTTHIQDRSKARKKKLGPKLNEDTLQMQARYEEQGYHNIAEIMFLMANDSYENLVLTEKEHGIHSDQYKDAFAMASKAASNAAPYFCKALKSNIEVTANIQPDDVDEAIKKLLDKNKT